jgi:hypothetical protein
VRDERERERELVRESAREREREREAYLWCILLCGGGSCCVAVWLAKRERVE